MDGFGSVFVGTLLTIIVVVFLVVVSRGVKKRLFPSENEKERSEAMTELLLLEAKLQERAREVPNTNESSPGNGDRQEVTS
jgi:hypothetical protein